MNTWTRRAVGIAGSVSAAFESVSSGPERSASTSAEVNGVGSAFTVKRLPASAAATIRRASAAASSIRLGPPSGRRACIVGDGSKARAIGSPPPGCSQGARLAATDRRPATAVARSSESSQRRRSRRRLRAASRRRQSTVEATGRPARWAGSGRSPAPAGRRFRAGSRRASQRPRLSRPRRSAPSASSSKDASTGAWMKDQPRAVQRARISSRWASASRSRRWSRFGAP